MSEELNPKPSIDERLEALTHSLELLRLENEQRRAENEQRKAEAARLDLRERRARKAILFGIATYLRVMNAKEGE